MEPAPTCPRCHSGDLNPVYGTSGGLQYCLGCKHTFEAVASPTEKRPPDPREILDTDGRVE